MKYRPTQEQVDFHQENGFVVIEDFLDPLELEAWRSAVDAATASRTSRIVGRGALCACGYGHRKQRERDDEARGGIHV